MKMHSISVLGVMVAAAGWLWLAAGLEIDGGFVGEAAYDLREGLLAQQLCMLGYVLIVWGAIISGFHWLKPLDTFEIAAPTPAKPLGERVASPLRRANTEAVPVIESVLDAVELPLGEPTPPKADQRYIRPR